MIHYISTNGIGNAWIAAELQIVQQEGIPCVLHSMRAPNKHFFGSNWAAKMDRNTQLIYPIRIISMLSSLLMAPMLFKSRFFAGFRNALFSERENIRARVACLAHFLVACDWARHIRNDDIDLIHSQWIQSGGTIGWYAAWLLDKPFSFTGHAVDLFQARSALKDKIRAADFIVAISEFHKQFYISEGANPDKIHIVYCGIDLSDYPYAWRPITKPARILSFGRLVEKKGFDTLIEACALLRDRGIEFECEIAGNGPDEKKLNALVDSLDLKEVVLVTGKPLLQEEIPDWLDKGHIFAQPCCWSHDNDVDGIPRSLMEAMAVGLPSISTRIAGIPDLVQNERTGLLIEPKDPLVLADAIERLINNHSIAKNISEGGRNHVEEHFNLETCLRPLCDIFRSKLL